ncbi:uncharacterized protein At5g19025 [Daucus carota subsp. sativus]|nr:PREDICTED: uncharacterized protein At5g19025-like [Daucus carota subsp. sativus]
MRHPHHHHLSSSLTTTTTTMPRHPSNPNPNNLPPSSSPCHHHSSSNIGDVIILILALFSGTFLISSYLSYIVHSVSLLIPIISPTLYALDFSLSIYYVSFTLFFVSTVVVFNMCFGSRKCKRVGCKGLKKALEFDLQLQNEECLRLDGKGVREVDLLPWKGGKESNPDYECLRGELRKMAPPNGRAVLIFRDKCGCPVAKLEGWSVKRGRKHKKSITFNGGDHR